MQVFFYPQIAIFICMVFKLKIKSITPNSKIKLKEHGMKVKSKYKNVKHEDRLFVIGILGSVSSNSQNKKKKTLQQCQIDHMVFHL